MSIDKELGVLEAFVMVRRRIYNTSPFLGKADINRINLERGRSSFWCVETRYKFTSREDGMEKAKNSSLSHLNQRAPLADDPVFTSN